MLQDTSMEILKKSIAPFFRHIEDYNLFSILSMPEPLTKGKFLPENLP